MKRIIALALVLVIALSLCACGGNKAPKATVTTNSGETKQMTLEDIREIADNNTPLFEKEYAGADITVTSTVTKIGGAYLYSPWFDCEAYLELESGDLGVWFYPIREDATANYNIGDTVTATGKIGMATVANFNVYILKTMNSPY